MRGFVGFHALLCFLLLAHPDCRPAAPGSQVEDAFAITLARGGGFTGLVRGFHLYSDGKVAAWRRYPAQPDSVLWTVQVEPGKIAEFARQLERTGALKKAHAATGNTTTRIVYSLPDSGYTWSWSNAGAAPAELKQWYVRVRQFCEQVREKRQRQREDRHED